MITALNPDGYALACAVAGEGARALLVLHGGPGGGSEYLRPLDQLGEQRDG